MTQQETQNLVSEPAQTDSFFEIDFETAENPKSDEEKKERANSELLSLEW
ncbi:hypothetical protein [Oceanithermus sp.]